MDTKTAFRFWQNECEFGFKGTFLIEFDTGAVHTIPGGAKTTIRLNRVGAHRIRASIDGYISDWTTINTADGDLVHLMILPPEGKISRAFGLLMGENEYLTIKEFDREKVPSLS